MGETLTDSRHVATCSSPLKGKECRRGEVSGGEGVEGVEERGTTPLGPFKLCKSVLIPQTEQLKLCLFFSKSYSTITQARNI